MKSLPKPLIFSRVGIKHFVPDTDYLALEAEDGQMRGRDALYDYNDGVFINGFHGKGYATLNNNVVGLCTIKGGYTRGLRRRVNAVMNRFVELTFKLFTYYY